MSKNVRSILIIRYSSMGDVIIIAPLLAVLRTHYPDAHIALLTRIPYAPVFKSDTRFSAIYAVDRNEMCEETTCSGTVWDFVVDLQHNRQSASQIARLQFVETGTFDKLRFKRSLLLLMRLNCYGSSLPVAHRYIAAAREEIPPGGLDFRIPFETFDGTVFRSMVRHGEFERPVIAFFPFSAWKNKEWGDRSFVSVGQFFSIKGWRVIILGGRSDETRAERMQYQIGRQCISFAGKLTLHECGRLLNHCSLALGCDTGLSHLSRACGVKTGFLYGPTTGHFGFQPQNDHSCRIFESRQFCRPCHPHGGNFCWRFNRTCMHAIDPEQVIYGMMQLFEGR